MVRSGSENAYGIYLSHMLFITTLTRVGWGQLSSVVPWPVLCLATVAIVLASGTALTSLLARTPLAVPLTGRAQVPWWLPRRLPLTARGRPSSTAQRARTGAPVRAASRRAKAGPDTSHGCPARVPATPACTQPATSTSARRQARA